MQNHTKIKNGIIVILNVYNFKNYILHLIFISLLLEMQFLNLKFLLVMEKEQMEFHIDGINLYKINFIQEYVVNKKLIISIVLIIHFFLLKEREKVL